MREGIKKFVEMCARTLPLEQPIYEFGAWQAPGQDADLRSVFPGADYTGCDMREGAGVDMIADLHDVGLADSSAATVICCDTLEHVEFPRRAMSEMHRILKNDGILIASSVMNFPIHGYPDDFWRFTPSGFQSLFRDFDESFIGSFGLDQAHPQTVVGVGFKGAKPALENFTQAYENWVSWQVAVMQKLSEDA